MRFIFANPQEVADAVAALGGHRSDSLTIQTLLKGGNRLAMLLSDYVKAATDYRIVVMSMGEVDKKRSCQDGVYWDGKMPPRCGACKSCQFKAHESLVISRNIFSDAIESVAESSAWAHAEAQSIRIQKALDGLQSPNQYSPFSPYEESHESPANSPD